MKKLYEKSELGFALVWIGIYCLGMSVFDEIILLSDYIEEGADLVRVGRSLFAEPEMNIG